MIDKKSLLLGIAAGILMEVLTQAVIDNYFKTRRGFWEKVLMVFHD
jgi:hypothetical protein